MKKLVMAGLLVTMMVFAWVLEMLIHWLVVGGECITYGHTLGMVVGLTALRLFFEWMFEK
jgi:hypothetical protein